MYLYILSLAKTLEEKEFLADGLEVFGDCSYKVWLCTWATP
jgi:hypothetical protein